MRACVLTCSWACAGGVCVLSAAAAACSPHGGQLLSSPSEPSKGSNSIRVYRSCVLSSSKDLNLYDALPVFDTSKVPPHSVRTTCASVLMIDSPGKYANCTGEQHKQQHRQLLCWCVLCAAAVELPGAQPACHEETTYRSVACGNMADGAEIASRPIEPSVCSCGAFPPPVCTWYPLQRKL